MHRLLRVAPVGKLYIFWKINADSRKDIPGGTRIPVPVRRAYAVEGQAHCLLIMPSTGNKPHYGQNLEGLRKYRVGLPRAQDGLHLKN